MLSDSSVSGYPGIPGSCPITNDRSAHTLMQDSISLESLNYLLRPYATGFQL